MSVIKIFLCLTLWMLKQADSMIAPMSPTIFRILILCSVILGTAAAFLDTLFPELIPQSIAQAVENEDKMRENDLI